MYTQHLTSTQVKTVNAHFTSERLLLQIAFGTWHIRTMHVIKRRPADKQLALRYVFLDSTIINWFNELLITCRASIINWSIALSPPLQHFVFSAKASSSRLSSLAEGSAPHVLVANSHFSNSNAKSGKSGCLQDRCGKTFWNLRQTNRVVYAITSIR